MRCRYVLPTASNVCSYTTLAKINCQIPMCVTTAAGLSPQNFVLEPDAAPLRERPQRTFRALDLSVLLKLSSFVSVSDTILL